MKVKCILFKNSFLKKKRDYIYILFSLNKIFNYKNQISLSYQIDLKDQFKTWLLLRIASIECSIDCRIIKIKCRLLEIDKSNDERWNSSCKSQLCRLKRSCVYNAEATSKGGTSGNDFEKKSKKKNARGKKGKGADDRRTWCDDVIHSRDEGGRIHMCLLYPRLFPLFYRVWFLLPLALTYYHTTISATCYPSPDAPNPGHTSAGIETWSRVCATFPPGV